MAKKKKKEVETFTGQTEAVATETPPPSKSFHQVASKTFPTHELASAEGERLRRELGDETPTSKARVRVRYRRADNSFRVVTYER